jgi:hypothetical protein
VRAIAVSEWRLISGRISKKADRSQESRPAKRKTDAFLRMLKLGCCSLSMCQRLSCGKLNIHRRLLFRRLASARRSLNQSAEDLAGVADGGAGEGRSLN